MSKKAKINPSSQSAAKTVVKEKKQIEINPKVFSILFVLFLGILALIRLRLLTIPLERDEGGFGYIGGQILDGIDPYKHALDSKPPFLYALMAVFVELFGRTASGLHTGLLIFNLGSTSLIYLIGRKLFSPAAALASAISFGFLSLSYTVAGFAAQATPFCAFFGLAGLYFLVADKPKQDIIRTMLAGLFMGISFMMKQNGVFFILFGGLAILFNFFREENPRSTTQKIKDSGIYSLFAIIPFLIGLLWMSMAGALHDYLHIDFVVTYSYGTKLGLNDGLDLLMMSFPMIVDGYYLTWILAGIGILLLFSDEIKALRNGMGVFFLMSFLTIVPGFYFREYYYVTFIPAIALLAGTAAYYGELYLKKKGNIFSFIAPLIIIIIVLIPGISSQSNYLFKEKPEAISRRVYGTSNPFPEAIQIAKYIKDHTKKGDKIAVLGSEPEIYFYSGRASASRYIFAYGMLENGADNDIARKEMQAEIIQSKPEFIVFVRSPLSWIIGKANNDEMMKWFQDYSTPKYDLKGIVDIVDKYTTNYIWESALTGYQPVSQEPIYILQKKAVK